MMTICLFFIYKPFICTLFINGFDDITESDLFCMKDSVFDKTANDPYLGNNRYTRLKINVGCKYLCFIPLPT